MPRRRLNATPGLGFPLVAGMSGILAANKMLDSYSHQRRYEEREQSYKRARVDPTPTAVADTPNMARRTRSRTLVRRRTKRSRRGRLRRVRRAVSLWPGSKLVKFRCVYPFSITTGAGTINNASCTLNSLNDPFGGAAGQELPLGLDQWAAMYSRYCIVGARVFVKVHNVSSTGAAAYGLTVLPGTDNTNYTSAAHYLEMPSTKSRILSPDMDHSGLGLAWSAKRHFRVSKLRDERNLHGTFSTTPGSPTNVATCKFWVQDVNSTEACTIEGYWTVEYICLLMDRIYPSRSTV